MAEPRTFQQILTDALRERGYRTLREASRATGLSVKTLRGALSGATTPSVQTLLKLSSKLGIESDALLRLGLRAQALGERLRGQQGFFSEWDLVASRARALGSDVERDLLDRCDWYLRGAETRRRSKSRPGGGRRG